MLGLFRRVVDWQGTAGVVQRVPVRYGAFLFGMAGMVRIGIVRPGEVRSGTVRCVMVRFGMAGEVMYGVVLLGTAR